MARTKQPSLLRAKIIKAASELFFENGFSKTTSSELCAKVGMGTGNLTFYFPTKEHILAVLVQMMIDYQWKEMENAADEGKSSLLAYCLELSALVAIADEFPEMNDFFAAAYSHPMTLELIRANDVEKVKQVFSEYTQGWDDERYTENEAITSGIEYATIMKTEHSASVEHRILIIVVLKKCLTFISISSMGMTILTLSSLSRTFLRASPQERKSKSSRNAICYTIF